jgi:poly-gamma-glutamate capsule biosynthesis protein CapA/YwtB (metallophosphatase superfamily)
VRAMADRLLTLFLGGDVVTARGVDQILSYPGTPTLRERFVRDARTYVDLAEAVNGQIERPVHDEWIWGDALEVLDEAEPAARIVNLETSITESDDFAPGKAVHYRMSPRNIGCLTVAQLDVCVLANNHVLDFGPGGLVETRDTLTDAGIQPVGAGEDRMGSQRPALVESDGARIVVASFGAESSGIPPGWAAGQDRPGVNLLPDLKEATVEHVAEQVRTMKRPGDITVVSIHWGSNWGYEVSREQFRFAHWLVDYGIDVVHGHSSHHPRPVEEYLGKLILYGCGDLIDDYEGIRGFENYRDDLRLIYLPTLSTETGELAELRMVPMQARQMRLCHPSGADRAWLREILDRISSPFHSRIGLDDGVLTLSTA